MSCTVTSRIHILFILCLFSFGFTFFFPDSLQAACTDNTPGMGDTVTCTGTDTVGIQSPAITNITVNVNGGALVSRSDLTGTINILHNGIINNSGTISNTNVVGVLGVSAGTGSVVTNLGTISSTAGVAINGAVGLGLTVINSGTISGGTNAFLGSAGADTFEVRSGSSITGVVDGAVGTDIFRLGGTSNASFNVSTIGAGLQFRNFETFQKQGTSSWTLTGTGTQNWTVSGGTLIGDTNSLQGNVTNSASVNFTQAFNGTYSSVVSGSGGLTKAGAGTLTLSGINTYTGATTINGGTLQLGAAGRLADATALTVGAGATFNLNNFDETIGSLAGAGNVTLGTGTLTAGGDNSSTTFSGIISGSGGLTKTGTGTLTLSGNNTYTGATTINGGTLQLGAANRLADATALTVGAGATFNLNNFDETIGSLAGAGNVTLGAGTLTTGGDNSSTTFSGVVSGTGGLTKTGTGTLTVSGNNTYTGATTINGGTLQLGAANRLADATALTVGAGATFNLNNFDETIGSLAGSGNVTLGTGTLTAGGNNSSTTFSGVVSGTGGLTKAGTGTLTVSGNNTYTGATTINGGTLQLGAAGRLADTTALTVGAGATFDLNNFDETVGSLAGAGNVTLGTGTLTAGGDNSSTTFSGIISGSGGLTKAGTGTLTVWATIPTRGRRQSTGARCNWAPPIGWPMRPR